jgi:hypothetical protein
MDQIAGLLTGSHGLYNWVVLFCKFGRPGQGPVWSPRGSAYACLVVDFFPAAALPPEPGRENHHLGSSFCSPSPFAGTSLTRNQPVVREHPPLLDFRPLARARRKTTAPAWASSSCPRQRRHLSLEGKITALLPPARARHNRRPSAAPLLSPSHIHAAAGSPYWSLLAVASSLVSSRNGSERHVAESGREGIRCKWYKGSVQRCLFFRFCFANL